VTGEIAVELLHRRLKHHHPCFTKLLKGKGVEPEQREGFRELQLALVRYKGMLIELVDVLE
jgi:hypothetical protein